MANSGRGADGFASGGPRILFDANQNIRLEETLKDHIDVLHNLNTKVND